MRRGILPVHGLGRERSFTMVGFNTLFSVLIFREWRDLPGIGGLTHFSMHFLVPAHDCKITKSPHLYCLLTRALCFEDWGTLLRDFYPSNKSSKYVALQKVTLPNHKEKMLVLVRFLPFKWNNGAGACGQAFPDQIYTVVGHSLHAANAKTPSKAHFHDLVEGFASPFNFLVG